ncbi:nucleotidyltransferase family protein [Amycolatopsis sp. NPDC051102]|uniref:nucleotidyltransferase family protein n=1 Tax=Amycolatopsis sp. NPDC051102 TaxID=3155163 RepID=UPI0034218DE8
MADPDRLQEALARNEVLVELLRRARGFGLPGWYFTAGCVVQTVWNVLTGRAPTHVHLWCEANFARRALCSRAPRPRSTPFPPSARAPGCGDSTAPRRSAPRVRFPS